MEIGFCLGLSPMVSAERRGDHLDLKFPRHSFDHFLKEPVAAGQAGAAGMANFKSDYFKKPEIGQLIFGQMNIVIPSVTVALAEALDKITPHSLDTFFFSNSGAEANEAAIKLARKYAKERHGDEGRYEIITMENSFHGRTMGALSATGQKKFHKGFAPLLPGFQYVPFDDLKAVEGSIGPQTCAVMVEPIQAEGGVNLPSPGYLKGLRKLCDQTGIVLIYDEVQVGMGRTGKFFAYQHWDAPPHIMTLAKSLANGVPIGAMVATDEVAQAFSPGNHATTFGGNPLATRVGCVVIDTLLEGGILQNCQEMGTYLLKGLLDLKERYTSIKDVRGKGLMIGAELAFEGKEIVDRCLERGFLINCTTDRVLRFIPPLIVTQDEINRLLSTLDEVFSER